MKKLLTRYYLLLAFILLGAAGNTYALESAGVSYTEKATLNHNESSFYATALHDFTALSEYNTPHFEKHTDRIETSNNEEDEEEFSLEKFHSAKKFYVGDYAFLSINFAPATEISTDTFIKLCPSGRYFHTLSSRQYLLYEVFRI